MHVFCFTHVKIVHNKAHGDLEITAESYVVASCYQDAFAIFEQQCLHKHNGPSTVTQLGKAHLAKAEEESDESDTGSSD